MARSLAKHVSTCALLCALHGAAAAQRAADCEELLFTSESLTFDQQTNLIELVGPQITQCTLRIEADEALATGIDFDSRSEWRLTGNVRITVDTAVIEADRAVFTFEQKRLSRGELEGTPALFRDVDPTTKQTITGQANKMSYDYVGRTLRLTQDAWVQRDRIEMTGCDLIYDFGAERVTSGSTDCGDLFRVRAVPRSEPAEAPAAPQ
jgi:lipopolysaccharide transport protein LptA